MARRPLTAAENFQRIVNGIDFSDENFGKQGPTETTERNVSSRIPDETWKLIRDQIRYFQTCYLMLRNRLGMPTQRSVLLLNSWPF